jgi:hypothetical protein
MSRLAEWSTGGNYMKGGGGWCSSGCGLWLVLGRELDFQLPNLFDSHCELAFATSGTRSQWCESKRGDRNHRAQSSLRRVVA